MRLGLALADIGEKAGVKVSDEEFGSGLYERRALISRPGKGDSATYYRKNPEALAEIRGPLYEEKVVDHMVGLCKVDRQTVSQRRIADVR